MSISKIPQSELNVMKVIWAHNDPMSSKEVITELSEKAGWKRTTTLTLLSKLVQKEFLSAEKIKLYTYYTAKISKKDYLEFETRYFFTNIHENSLKSLITALHDNNELTNDDLDDLEKWIKNQKE
ncbi:BlaI/MecI/CopY family transcriptional regulator [Clostridium beijerinckii]|uniref:Transcriptional regulator n=1 Tax=Clostridium beijerinckii TaxID=1520 RepID=A0AAE5H3Z8_CLOBE|nr:BlaI/MecI/CopY family transcriptional regulator [Clostridium beijerinckii]MBE6087911.1 BlaI/MecI/CopY family transcriptional regulator [Clostridium beijerinckii]NSB13893.1 putative transcriptional regulator [Clostridium beijerinckii]OOM22796.1 penicillinase repressor [Clostridium beijerinckii]